MRIDPDLVREAFLCTGLTPHRSNAYDDLTGEAQAPFAVAKHTGIGLRVYGHLEALCVSDFVSGFKLPVGYLSSFLAGWSGEKCQGMEDAWKDGVRSWEQFHLQGQA